MFCTRLANRGLFPTGDPIVPFVISPRFECLNKLTHTHTHTVHMALVGYLIVFSFVTKCGQTIEFLLWGTIVPLNFLVGYHCSIIASTPQSMAYAFTHRPTCTVSNITEQCVSLSSRHSSLSRYYPPPPPMNHCMNHWRALSQQLDYLSEWMPSVGEMSECITPDGIKKKS